MAVSLPFMQFLHVYAHRHSHAGTLLEVQAKRLTLKVGLLISRISSRSKMTIKGGCFWYWGLISITTHGRGHEKVGRRSLITEHRCAYVGPHAGWLAISKERASGSDTHTHGCTQSRAPMHQHLWWWVQIQESTATSTHARIQMYSS